MPYAATSASRAHAPRLLYLDNLRVFLTVLVIAHHSSIAWGAPGGWYYVIPPPEDSIAPIVLTFFTGINQAFFMSLFFLLSAFFTPLSYDKKGAAAFLKDRLKRLGIPLVAYFFVLNPSLVYLLRRFRGATTEGYLDFMRHNALHTTGTGPLWFVLALLIFAGAYVGVRRAYPADSRGERTRPLPTNRAMIGFVIAIGIAAFAVRLWWPVGTGILGLQFGYFPLYVSMYIFGVWACRFGWLNALTRRQANYWFGASLVLILLMPVLMVVGGALSDGTDSFMGGMHWQAFAYAAWEPTLCLGISMKLLVLFRDRFNRAGRLSRSLSRSAYTTYILHPFFVVVGTYWLSEAAIPPLLKFLVLTVLATTACFAVSDVVRRAPLLRKIL